MQDLLINNPWAILLITLWVLPWKGVALWKASKNDHKRWFIGLLVINSFALLEIVYIFVFSKKRKEEVDNPKV